MLVRVALFAMAVLPFKGHRLNEFTPDSLVVRFHEMK
jgi:hypothetical protein